MTENHNSDIEVWYTATTLEDIGELTARWIEGTSTYHPCYGSSTVDYETRPLRQILAGYNRKGLITTFSQPGEPIDDEGNGQRASLQGYAQEALAKRIAALGLHTDLLVFIFEPSGGGGYQVPITIQDFQPLTWNGGCLGYEELECFAEDCSEEALQSLKEAWSVIVIDPQWGRESYLWEYVCQALDNPQDDDKPFDITPWDSEALDTDFIR